MNNKQQTAKDIVSQMTDEKIPTLSDRQHKLFDALMMMKHRIHDLSKFMQNDISTMLDDGSITVGDIQIAIHDMDAAFDTEIEVLTILQIKCNAFMIDCYDSQIQKMVPVENTITDELDVK